MGIFSRKTEEEKWAEAKLDPRRNARAQQGLTPAQKVTRQTKHSEARNKRKGG